MDHPDPLIFEPLQLPHRQTFILLHGRGSWAENFGSELLRTPVGNSRPASPECSKNESSADGLAGNGQTTELAMTLQTTFHHAPFVFPTAPWRRATIYRRARTHQWFDNWKLDLPATEREELQIEGLHETTKYLHRLLHKEISIVPGGSKNVVCGLSQGCAASLVALLLWEGEDLGAMIGMCGWLPFAGCLMAEIQGEEDEEHKNGDLGFDQFAADEHGDIESSDEARTNPAQRAVGWLREQLDLPALQLPSEIPLRSTPVFLGHGAQDEKVSIELGRRSTKVLGAMGSNVCWKEYNELDIGIRQLC